MSLEAVVEDIRNEAEAEAERIVSEAEAEADRIVEDAKAGADRIVEEAEVDAEATVEREREQRLSSANLEAKQRRLEARREALEAVRDRVEAEIESFDDERRETLTRTLLEAAATEFEDGEALEVYARPADRDLVETVLEDYDGYELAGEYGCLGGVVVEGEAGDVRVNNTFDSVLETVWDRHVKAFSETLFEEQ